MKKSNLLYLLVVIVFIITYASIAISQAGIRPTLIICGSMIGGMVLWIKTTFRTPIDPKKILPVYLLTLGAFFLHIGEEMLTNFPGGLNGIFNINWNFGDFTMLIVLAGPIIWILGAVAFYFRNPLGYFVVWFIFFAMVVGEPTHYLIFPLMQGGRYSYFSGMWTALFPMVPAIYGICLTVAEYRKQRKIASI